MYATWVSPTRNVDPEEWDLTVVTDEASVTVGSVQDTVVPGVPSSLLASILSGHPDTFGGSRSGTRK